MAPIELTSLRATFFDEADEHVAVMEATLLALEHAPRDRELLNQIFRAAHTIKGGSGAVGLHDILRYTHALEGLLHRLREGVITFTQPLADLLLRATDVLEAALASAQAGERTPAALDMLLNEIECATPADPDAMTEDPELRAAVAAGGCFFSSVPPALRTYRVLFAPGPNILRHGLDPLLVVRDLAELGYVVEMRVDTTALPDLDVLDPQTSHLLWEITLATARNETEIRDVFAFVEETSTVEISVLDAPAVSASSPGPLAALSETSPSARPSRSGASVEGPLHPSVTATPAHSRARTTVRVDTEKLDELINLVGELVIAQSMVSTAMNDVAADGAQRLRDAIDSVDRNMRELQGRIMAVRMIPMGTVFNRFPRMVREIAASLGKAVHLEVDGNDVELDKGMVEKLGDPLMHLVRNAVDHGIESPAERRSASKPAEGMLRICAFHQGGSVVIEVTDDGRGLDPEGIRKKGLALGLLAPHREPTVEELHSLIFAPGFSTAQTVTDVSGRGVGMDVVKRNVQALNGTIAFTSKPGQGSRIQIRLPLTMAIMEALCLRVGAQVFVLPLIAIVESFRPTRDQLRKVLGRGEVVRVRGEAIALVRLHEVLAVPDAEVDPCRGLICIIEAGTTRVALLVDELLGQSQVVVKTLETNFRRVDGVMGATILGDGSVALILDASAFARKDASSIQEGRGSRHDTIGSVA